MNREDILAKYGSKTQAQPKKLSRENILAKYGSSTPKTNMSQDTDAAVVGKGLGSGILSILDAPQAIASGVEEGIIGGGGWLANKFRDTPLDESKRPQGVLKTIKPLSSYPKALLKHLAQIDLEAKPKDASQRRLHRMGEWVGGGWREGIKGAGLNALSGEASHELQESGVNPFLADLAGGIGTRGAIKAAPRIPEVSNAAARSILGVSPKQHQAGTFDVDTLRAAKDLGIDLPLSAVTDSRIARSLDKSIGVLPHYSHRLQDKYEKVPGQMRSALEEVYDMVGSPKTDAVNNQINQMYGEADKFLPKNDLRRAEHTLASIRELQDNHPSLLKTSQNQPITSVMEQLQKGLSIPKKLDLWDAKKGMPISIKTLQGTKRDLGDEITWGAEQGAKNRLRHIYGGVKKDLESYGETNLPWWEATKQADQFTSGVKKRAELSKLLDKAIKHSSGEVNENTLSNLMHRPESAAEIKRLAGPEAFTKLQKLEKVSSAFAKRDRKLADPKAEALWATAIGLGSGLTLAPLSTIAATLGTEVATRLLTSEKFLNKALDIAEKANKGHPIPKSIERSFLKTVEDLTGKNPTVLTNELYRQQESAGGI